MVKQKKWICCSGLILFVGNNFGIPVDRTRDVSQRGALHNVRIWSVLFHIHFSSKISFSQKKSPHLYYENFESFEYYHSIDSTI